MAMHYTAADCEWLKAHREAQDPGIELVKCEDGIYRTPQEKTAYEEHVTAEIRRLS
jgi:hypothetical protein